MTWTDEELVARSKTGDAESFNQLVKRWERPIFALAYRTLGREEEARDVTQETFLRAFRALRGFKGDAKFSSWLYRIALNLCRDVMRKDPRRSIWSVSPASMGLPKQSKTSPPAAS
jgi:RNA polymerase sigma-70 factor (ECF subfamily)